MSSFRASAALLYAAALLAAVALTGCATSHLSSETPPDVRLAGDWRIDPARSDDLGKAVSDLQAQMAKARHNSSQAPQQGFGGYGRHGHMGGGQQGGQQGGEAGPDESSSGTEGSMQGLGVMPPPRSSPVDELMSSVPQGDYLRIKVSPGAFTVISGDSSDEYTPGQESDISAEQGDATQISGWKGSDYLIDTKPQWGAETIQSYGLTQDGKLAMTVRLSGRGVKFTFTRVYDRTTNVVPLAPPTVN